MWPLLAAIGVGLFVTVAFWDEITDWIQDFTQRLKRNITKIGRFAAKLFAAIITGDYELIHRMFFKKDGEWYEQTTTRKIEESKVPAWAKAQVGSAEKDVSDRYEKELDLTLS